MLIRLVKALLLIALIFGVLYFGLDWYFSRKAPPAPAPHSKNLDELKVLREESALLEQRIQDLKKEGQPSGDQESELVNLRANIDNLKKLVASEMPAIAPEPDAGPGAAPPVEGFFSDPMRTGVLGVLAGLLAVLLFAWLYQKLKPAPVRNRIKPPPARAGGRAEPPSAPEPMPFASVPPPPNPEALLKDTLERFRGLSPEIRKTETREVPLKMAVPPEPLPEVEFMEPVVVPEEVLPPQPVHAKAPVEPTGPTAGGPELIDAVFELNRKGFPVDEIARQMHIDQDQVRLILRFRHS